MQTRIYDGIALVEASAKGRKNPVDRHKDLLGGSEHAIRLAHHARTFEEDRVAPVDHDLGDGWVIKQRLERAEAQNLVQHLTNQPVARRHLHPLIVAGVQDCLARDRKLLPSVAGLFRRRHGSHGGQAKSLHKIPLETNPKLVGSRGFDKRLVDRPLALTNALEH